MCQVREVERWKAKAALGKTSIDEVWFALSKLTSEGSLLVSEQREIVWDSFRIRQTELRGICPYFDPRHEVWHKSESTEGDRAMMELSRIMTDDRAMRKWQRISRPLCLGFCIIMAMTSGRTVARDVLGPDSLRGIFEVVFLVVSVTILVPFLTGCVMILRQAKNILVLPETA